MKVANTLNIANLEIVTANMNYVEGKYVPLIRMIHQALDKNDATIAALRLQYIYSGSAPDRATLKTKIAANENRFVSTEWEFSGFVAYINNNFDQAGIDLNKAVASDPSNTDAYYARGLYYAAAKQDKLAIADYSTAIKADPTLFDAYNRRGNLYFSSGDLTAALVDYSSCISLRPDSINSYIARGGVYVKLNQSDKALVDYNKALAFAPDNYAALCARSNLFIQEKQYDLAIVDLTTILKTDPKDVVSLINRGNCYYAKGNSEAALADYKLAITYGDRDPAKFLDIAVSSYNNKQYPQALDAINLYISHNTSNAQAYFVRAEVQDAKNNFEAAIPDYTTALTLNPNDAITLTARANDYYLLAANKQVDYALAVADCSNAIQLNSQYAPAYKLRGKCYQYQANYNAGIADFTSYIGLKPTDAEGYNLRGECYAAAGDKNSARADFNTAIKMDPGNPAYIYDLALFFDKSGRAKSDVVRAYQTFISVAGASPVWSEQVAQAKARIAQLANKN